MIAVVVDCVVVIQDVRDLSRAPSRHAGWTSQIAQVNQRGSQRRGLARHATTVTGKPSEVDSLSHLPARQGFSEIAATHLM